MNNDIILLIPMLVIVLDVVMVKVVFVLGVFVGDGEIFVPIN